MDFDPLSKRVIGLAIDVHRELGPGLLESVYERCLVYELQERGFRCASQVPMPVRYKGVAVDCGFRIDIVVEDRLLLELKSVDSLQRVHEAQTLTYMKLAGIPRALLINFNTPLLRDGLKRLVL